MEYPMEYLKWSKKKIWSKKSCIGQIKYFRNMVNPLDVHTYIYFELASSPIVPVR